jgi:hypothetical protein
MDPGGATVHTEDMAQAGGVIRDTHMLSCTLGETAQPSIQRE